MAGVAAPPPAKRRVARKAAWLALAFLAMVVLAVASMVRFTGERSVVRPATPAPTPVADGTLLLPVAGVQMAQVLDTWGEARDEGARAHHGTDIMAPHGTPVLAAAAGTVEKLFESGAGGTTLYVRSPDRRWSYYYAHLAGYAPGVAEGRAVRTGETLGYVGDTGNAGAGNYHLHFGISRMAPDDTWSGGEPVDPYPRLAASAARR